MESNLKLILIHGTYIWEWISTSLSVDAYLGHYVYSMHEKSRTLSYRQSYSSCTHTHTHNDIITSNFSMDVTPNSITFIWEHISQNCPGLYYNVTSMDNCGVCPPGTEMSQITCSDFVIPRDGINCTLTIQTIICWETDVAVSGNTASATLFLKGNHADSHYH